VEQATVVIQQQDLPNRLLGILTTDLSGLTPVLTLDAPDQVFSQSPEDQVQPWTGLTVQVEHPDYQQVTLQGVQLFPGIRTLQNVLLLPLPEYSMGASPAQVTDFPAQDLWKGGGT
jgi:hypothetical protein